MAFDYSEGPNSRWLSVHWPDDKQLFRVLSFTSTEIRAIIGPEVNSQAIHLAADKYQAWFRGADSGAILDCRLLLPNGGGNPQLIFDNSGVIGEPNGLTQILLSSVPGGFDFIEFAIPHYDSFEDVPFGGPYPP